MGLQPVMESPATDQRIDLRFEQVPFGRSRTRRLVIEDGDGRPIDLEVLRPPLAPFSVHQRRFGGQHTPGRPGLSIRYDATAPMAVDRGSLVVHDPTSGRRWLVILTGSGELAAGERAR
ncbi:MAG: hypothetical protein AAF547_19920 [Actinomycetota bacterium]